MPGYPLHPTGNQALPAGWTGSVTDPAAPAGGNGPGHSAPYPIRHAEAESWFWGAVHGVEHFAEAAYDAGVSAAHDLEDTAVRAGNVVHAMALGMEYSGPAIVSMIGMDAKELWDAFIPGMIYCLKVLAASTLGGAAAGLVIGLLSGGTVAVPAVAAGSELGLDLGLLILDYLGIGMLVEMVIAGLPRIFELEKSAMATAWNAGADPKRPAITDIDLAAHQFANASAEMMNLVLEGIVIWLFTKSSLARYAKLSRNAGNLTEAGALAARGNEVIQALKNSPKETRAAIAAGAAELGVLLRKGKTAAQGLSRFVESNSEQIIRRVTEKVTTKAEGSKTGPGGLVDDGAGGGSVEKSTSSTPAPSGSPIDYDHTIGADYTKKGKPTGGHSLLNNDVRVVPGTETVPDKAGVYQATVQMPDPNNPGQWITKTSNNSINTMFPKDWTEARLKSEVDAAWNSPNKVVTGDQWNSVTPSGVQVQGYVSPRTTVYPVYQGPPTQ